MASCVSWPTVRMPVPTTVRDPAASGRVSETSASVSADTSPPPVAVVGRRTRGGALLETLERQLERRELQRRELQWQLQREHLRRRRRELQRRELQRRELQRQLQRHDLRRRRRELQRRELQRQ